MDSLIEEDDSVPNVWYMLAMCLLGGGQTEAAAEALQHGQKLLRKQNDVDDLAKDFCDLKVYTLLECQLLHSIWTVMLCRVCLLQFNLVTAGLMDTRGGCLCMALPEAFQAANLLSDLCLCVMTSSDMSCIAAADKYMHR